MSSILDSDQTGNQVDDITIPGILQGNKEVILVVVAVLEDYKLFK